MAGHRRFEGLVVGADDFLVGGEQEHLMGGGWEVAFHEVLPV